MLVARQGGKNILWAQRARTIVWRALCVELWVAVNLLQRRRLRTQEHRRCNTDWRVSYVALAVTYNCEWLSLTLKTGGGRTAVLGNERLEPLLFALRNNGEEGIVERGGRRKPGSVERGKWVQIEVVKDLGCDN